MAGDSKVNSVDQRPQVDVAPHLDPAVAEPTPSLWRAAHLTRLVALDGLVIWIALTTAAYSRRGVTALSVTASGDISYGLLVFTTAAFWLLALSARGAYESRFYGTGPEEYKRVISATLVTFGTVAVISYAFKLQLPRSFVAVSLPLGLGPAACRPLHRAAVAHQAADQGALAAPGRRCRRRRGGREPARPAGPGAVRRL